MIELLRYARHKAHPKAPVSAAAEPDGVTVRITFKRFDVSTAEEIPPEESFITFSELEQRRGETLVEMQVLEELLALKPK